MLNGDILGEYVFKTKDDFKNSYKSIISLLDDLYPNWLHTDMDKTIIIRRRCPCFSKVLGIIALNNECLD